MRRRPGVPAGHIHRDFVLRQIPRVRQRSGHIGKLPGFHVPATVSWIPDRPLRLQVHENLDTHTDTHRHRHTRNRNARRSENSKENVAKFRAVRVWPVAKT